MIETEQNHGLEQTESFLVTVLDDKLTGKAHKEGKVSKNILILNKVK